LFSGGRMNFNVVKNPIVFTPDTWQESWIPNYDKLDYEVKVNTLDVMSSYHRQVVELSRSWEYELILPAHLACPQIATTGVLAMGTGEQAMSQRILFAAGHVEKGDAQEGWRVLQLIGTEPPVCGLHMPKLVRFRFELGDGTFVAMMLAEHEMHLFNKQEYIERVYG
jgi:hypothetical protein